MKKGAYVLIFFFWAVITFITPTLVQWSAATAMQLQLQSKYLITGKKGDGFMARKMMVTLVRQSEQRKPKVDDSDGGVKSAPPPAAVEPPAPAPAPVLKSMGRAEGILLQEMDSKWQSDTKRLLWMNGQMSS
ncbi:hypothetical protein Ancab_028933 [Ancistrocladus abbreviatus]